MVLDGLGNERGGLSASSLHCNTYLFFIVRLDFVRL